MSELDKSIEDILAQDFSEEFVQRMKNRAVVSHYKYGWVRDGFPDKVNAIASAMDRLRVYARGDSAKGIKAGNKEMLVDAANFLMFESMHPRHPEAHFEAGSAEQSPGRVVSDTGLRSAKSNLELE